MNIFIGIGLLPLLCWWPVLAARTTRQLDSEDVFDLCIVGVGMFGSAAARHASAQPNLRVCIIGPEEPKTRKEKASREIFGSHYDEGRIIQLGESEFAIQNFAKESTERFPDLEKLTGISFYTPIGSITVDQKHSESAMTNFKALVEGNVHFVEYSSSDLLAKRYPFLNISESRNVILIDDNRSGYLSSRKMILAQNNVSAAQGCRFVKDVVSEISPSQNGVHTIRTEKSGDMKAKRVLVTAGGFTNFKDLIPKKLSVFLVRELVVRVRISEDDAQNLSSMPTISINDLEYDALTDTAPGSYILPPIQYPDGKFYLKVGHLGRLGYPSMETLQQVGDWYNSKGNSDHVNILVKRLRIILPGVKFLEILPTTCVTADTPSGLPYIDRLTPTLAVAAFGNSLGATMSEEVGRVAAHLALTGEWDSEVSKSLFEAIYHDN